VPSDETEHDETYLTFYHGTRAKWAAGAQLNPNSGPLYLSPHLDAAIWAAELSEGEQEPRVYRVLATGSVEDAAKDVDYVAPPHPTMSLRTQEPLEVIEEITTFDHYHGTKATLHTGDLIEPGNVSNYGPGARTANFVYFTRTLDASIWGAELAAGDGRERIYLVEPIGAVEDDPNLTNKRFRGNPTKSFRSRAPLRITGELLGWAAHSPEAVTKMKEGLARLAEAGRTADDG
jgi:rifampin ADP-ribosylating transferase